MSFFVQIPCVLPAGTHTGLVQSIFPVHNINQLCQQITVKCNTLRQENQHLRQEIDFLKRSIHHQRVLKSRRTKRKRRSLRELSLNFACPYTDCGKFYASELAINLHLQKKHNGGTKTEREALAVTLEMTQRLLLLAEKTGGKAPELTITFPPGFLESFRQKFFEVE